MLLFRRTVARFGACLLTATALGLLTPAPAAAQSKVVLQGFWWDYWNNNYQNAWANYLTELAPRLRTLGVDAVWIPPTTKSANTGNGYSPFDHYDLGEKYQKGFTGTRVGNKDQLLRMVAVLHANGIEVVQDIVLNHTDGAGSANGSGGQDPAAWEDYATSKYKNFRYVSYTTPAADESATNYWARSGRWAKNWPNFHPNAGANSYSGDWNAPFFGPDNSYESGGYGQSSNATGYNPAQSADYMRNQARQWLIWYKKQVGFDGVRLDAVKHFPDWATEDFLANLQNNADWASGGAGMYAVGEWVGSSGQMDGWCNNVQNRAGTFDFSLRNAISSLVSSGGSFDIGTLPTYQQGNRVFYQGGQWVHRTVPFVNNHDTFRPQVNGAGDYTGWNTGSELGPHVDPFDPRLSAAYAAALALDGSPQLFFEDVFNVGNTGKRYSHLPTSTTDLPVRDDLANLVWCHQNLRFKDGAYKIRWQAPDHLVIERSTKALIGINDSYASWQNNTVVCDFAPGTVLKDYSGANGTSTVTVSSGQTVSINTPPCNGSAALGRRGYSVWAPTGITQNYNRAAIRTTQEWEMANDLGDNHQYSLKQGGALPAASTAWRTTGRVYCASGQVINYNMYPTDGTRSVAVAIYNTAGTQVSSSSGTGTRTGAYTPGTTGWYTLKVKNNSTTNPAQMVRVKVNYMAPTVVNTATAGRPAGSGTDEPTGRPDVTAAEITLYPNPAPTARFDAVIRTSQEQTVTVQVFDQIGRIVHQQAEKLYPGTNELAVRPHDLPAGLYLVRVPELRLTHRVVLR